MEPQLEACQRSARQPEYSGAGHGGGVFTPLTGSTKEAAESRDARGVGGRRKRRNEEH